MEPFNDSETLLNEFKLGKAKLPKISMKGLEMRLYKAPTAQKNYLYI